MLQARSPVARSSCRAPARGGGPGGGGRGVRRLVAACGGANRRRCRVACRRAACRHAGRKPLRGPRRRRSLQRPARGGGIDLVHHPRQRCHSLSSLPRDSEHELLVAGARVIGVNLDAARATALLRLVDELELGNAQFNLTAIRDRPGMLRKARSRQPDPAALPARRPYRRYRHRRGISRPAARHRQPAAALYLGRGDRQESPIRRADGIAPSVRQCAGRERARGDLQAVRTFRHRGGAGAVIARRFCRLCGALVRPGRAHAGDEGQAAGRGNLRPAQDHSGSWRCIASACPGWTTNGISWNSHHRPNRANHEAGHRSCKSKRRGRKDHDRRQSRRLADGHETARAADRSRSAGQCHHGLRHRQAYSIAHQLRCAARRLRRDGGAGAGRVRRFHAHALQSGSHGGRGAPARHDHGPRVQVAQCA